MTHENDHKTLRVQSANYPELFFTINEYGQYIGADWQDVDTECKSDIEREEIAAQQAALYFTNDGVLDLSKWLVLHQQRKAEHIANLESEEVLNDKMEREIGPRPASIFMMYTKRFKERLVIDRMQKTAGSEYYELRRSTSAPLSVDGIKTLYEAWESGCGVAGVINPKVYKKGNGEPCPIPEIKAAYEYFKAKDAFDLKHDFKAMDDKCNISHNRYWDAEKAVCFAPAKTLLELADKADISAKVCDPFEGTIDYEKAILDSLARDIRTFANASRVRGAA